MLAKRDALASCPPTKACRLLFCGALNDVCNSVAAGVVVVWVKYPGADGGGLIGEEVEVVRGDDDFPDGLLGLFAKSIAAFVECCANVSNFLRDSECFGRFRLFHE